jgi:hypothetical protein
MDFIIAFVIFIFALAFFFSVLRTSLSYENISLNAPSELIFSRMDQIYVEDYDFLDGSVIDIEKLDDFVEKYTPNQIYGLIFRDFDNPSYFRTMEYCVFIENKTPEKSEIIKNFAVYTGESSLISFEDNGNPYSCGEDNYKRYSKLPHCDIKEAEALLLSKPVLYNKDIMNLKVLICAIKR